MIHIPEPIGVACAAIGSVFSYIYLQVEELNTEYVLRLNKTIVQMGLSMCIFSCGIFALIAAMEKWNKWREKVNAKKFKKFEEENRK